VCVNYAITGLKGIIQLWRSNAPELLRYEQAYISELVVKLIEFQFTFIRKYCLIIDIIAEYTKKILESSADLIPYL
jgi:hypothetical protein